MSYTRKKEKMFCGVGINDADYKTILTVDKLVVWKCPFYMKWTKMMNRCYGTSTHKNQPKYIGCAVVEEWKRFSNFKKWMESQDWEGKDLDKDLLIEDNKVYGPETCVFIENNLNVFINTKSNSSKYMGVCAKTLLGGSIKYYSMTGLPKTKQLGIYDNPMDAHIRWLEDRLELFKEKLVVYYDEPLICSGIDRIIKKIKEHIRDRKVLTYF